MILRDSTSSCSSAASVFSLREVQLQKDPGHRSSVFQPLGKTSSLHPGFPPLLAINCTFNSLSLFFLKLMFFFSHQFEEKTEGRAFSRSGRDEAEVRSEERKSCLFTPRHKDRRLTTLTRMLPFSTCTHLHARTGRWTFLCTGNIALARRRRRDAPHV